ncbi:MAG: T4SS-associated protein EirA [Gammaproteobacteria bacterium]|nr:T4SS-associated protein EirA [Gammaproteobacteria bacterium]
MLSKKSQLTMIILFCGPFLLAMAQVPASQNNMPQGTSVAQAAVAGIQPASPQLYCPEVKDLKNHAMIWHAGTKWRSYSPSFVKKIKAFVGAQWIGINVGKIICLYRGAEKITFPVALEPVHPVLVPTPNGAHWAPIPHRSGYRQCFSNNVMDCSFTQQQSRDTGNVFQQIKYQGATS